RAQAGALEGLEELLGDDDVRVDIGAVQGCSNAFVRGESLHGEFLSECANVDEMACHRCGSGHGRADQVGATALPLPAFEVATRGGGTTLARVQTVGVHGKTHGTARLTPFETGLEDRKSVG